MVICPICNGEFKKISPLHITRIHKMTIEEYKDIAGLYSLSITNNTYKDIAESSDLGKSPDLDIAKLFGVSIKAVQKIRKELGVAREHTGFVSQEGLPLNSLLEAMYDAYLHELGVAHTHEPVIVQHRKYRADFKVGNLFIEVRGMSGYKDYDSKQIPKILLYEEQNFKVIWLSSNTVQKLYKKCKTYTVICREPKVCSECSAPSLKLSKGMCRTCYSSCIYRDKVIENRCITCDQLFKGYPGKKYCGTKPSDCSKNKKVTIRGEVMTLNDALLKYKVPYKTYINRVFLGWEEESAVTIPKQSRAGRKEYFKDSKAVLSRVSRIVEEVSTYRVLSPNSSTYSTQIRGEDSFKKAVLESLEALGFSCKLIKISETKGVKRRPLITDRHKLVFKFFTL